VQSKGIERLGKKDRLRESLFSDVFADFEGEDSAADLHPLFAAAEIQRELLLLDEGAKLGLVVEDEEVAAHFGDFGVVPGDGDVGDSDFALVSASDLDSLLLDVLEEHHVVGLVGDALQYEMVALGLVDGQQFVFLSLLLDEARVFYFADFAEELLEVVLRGSAHHFLLDLGTVPLLEAAEVDQCAGAAAVAGRAEESSGLVEFSQHAVLALQYLVDVQFLSHDSFVVHPEFGSAGGLCCTPLMLGRSHQVFDSAQFDDVARTYVGKGIRSL
jgi:hypothetical protein